MQGTYTKCIVCAWAQKGSSGHFHANSTALFYICNFCCCTWLLMEVHNYQRHPAISVIISNKYGWCSGIMELPHETHTWVLTALQTNPHILRRRPNRKSGFFPDPPHPTPASNSPARAERYEKKAEERFRVSCIMMFLYLILFEFAHFPCFLEQNELSLRW